MQEAGTLAAVALVLSVVAVVAIGPAGPVGPVAGEHGSPGNWTALPVDAPEDRRPGNTEASYKHWAVGQDDFRDEGLEEIHYIVLTSETIGFTGCQLFNAQVFGIDRDNDESGTQTDEQIAPYVTEFDISEHKMWMRLEGGASTTFWNRSDEFVAHMVDCFDNPEERGWYRFFGWANGTAYDGEFDQADIYSHWVWICDCQSRDAAVEVLGPPPSAATPTATQTGGATTTATSEPTATRTPPEEGTPFTSPTATPTPVVTERPTADTVTATRTAAETPPPTDTETTVSNGDGPVFVIITLVAIIAALTITRIRR